MTVQMTIRWLALGALIGVFCCPGVAQEASRPGAMSLGSIVDALERTQAGIHPQGSYQEIREYRLFDANGSSSNSNVVAEVDFRPPSRKDYRIQKSSGSNRGLQVVRRILDNEVEAASKGSQGRTALNRDNYDFDYIGDVILDGQACYLLGLKPKRREKNLISGEVWVDRRSFFVRQVEGEVAKTPSWWLKKVHVKLTFADLDGTWLQVSMEAIADVRVLGRHTLTSHLLDYRGTDEVASTRTRSPNRKQ